MTKRYTIKPLHLHGNLFWTVQDQAGNHIASYGISYHYNPGGAFSGNLSSSFHITGYGPVFHQVRDELVAQGMSGIDAHPQAEAAAEQAGQVWKKHFNSSTKAQGISQARTILREEIKPAVLAAVEEHLNNETKTQEKTMSKSTNNPLEGYTVTVKRRGKKNITWEHKLLNPAGQVVGTTKSRHYCVKVSVCQVSSEFLLEQARRNVESHSKSPDYMPDLLAKRREQLARYEAGDFGLDDQPQALTWHRVPHAEASVYPGVTLLGYVWIDQDQDREPEPAQEPQEAPTQGETQDDQGTAAEAAPGANEAAEDATVAPEPGNQDNGFTQEELNRAQEAISAFTALDPYQVGKALEKYVGENRGPIVGEIETTVKIYGPHADGQKEIDSMTLADFVKVGFRAELVSQVDLEVRFSWEAHNRVCKDQRICGQLLRPEHGLTEWAQGMLQDAADVEIPADPGEDQGQDENVPLGPTQALQDLLKLRDLGTDKLLELASSEAARSFDTPIQECRLDCVMAHYRGGGHMSWSDVFPAVNWTLMDIEQGRKMGVSSIALNLALDFGDGDTDHLQVEVWKTTQAVEDDNCAQVPQSELDQSWKDSKAEKQALKDELRGTDKAVGLLAREMARMANQIKELETAQESSPYKTAQFLWKQGDKEATVQVDAVRLGCDESWSVLYIINRDTVERAMGCSEVTRDDILENLKRNGVSAWNPAATAAHSPTGMSCFDGPDLIVDTNIIIVRQDGHLDV